MRWAFNHTVTPPWFANAHGATGAGKITVIGPTEVSVDRGRAGGGWRVSPERKPIQQQLGRWIASAALGTAILDEVGPISPERAVFVAG